MLGELLALALSVELVLTLGVSDGEGVAGTEWELVALALLELDSDWDEETLEVVLRLSVSDCELVEEAVGDPVLVAEALLV